MNDSSEELQEVGVKRLNKLPLTIGFILVGFVALVFVYALIQRLSDAPTSAAEVEAAESQTVQTADNAEIVGDGPVAGVIPEAPSVSVQPTPTQRVINSGQPAVRYEGSGNTQYGQNGPNGQRLAGATQDEQEALAQLRIKNALELESYHLEKQMERMRFRDSAAEQAKSSPMNVAYDTGEAVSNAGARSAGASLGNFAGLDSNGLPTSGLPANASQSLADAQAAQLAALGTPPQGGGNVTDQNGQANKRGFVAGADTTEDYLNNRLADSISPYEVKQGTIIPALMVSGINSDLPGYMIGQVSQNVYDSVTGTNLLIPQGTRLFGQYDSGVTYGQNRVLIVWNRLILPNGKSINVDTMVGSDAAGGSGIKDKVNRHLVSLYGQAILLSAISGATEAITQSGNSNDSDLERAISREFGNGLQDTTQEVIEREVQRQPTITVRPGKKFVILVDQDIILEPYVSKSANRR